MDVMSNLQKSKRLNLTEMFNDTSRYPDDIFTIDYPEIAKHTLNIYPTELQLIEQILQTKKFLFWM